MTITQIEYFLAILKYGGFSAAADEIYISQSSLSKQIKSLESELDIELFTRANNKVFLTPGGKRFQKYAEAIQGSYTEMMQDLTQFRRSTAQEILTLGALPLMQDYHLSNQLAHFQEKMNNVQIDITEANQEALLPLLQSKKLDLAILRLDYLDSELYEFLPIREDKFVLVCSRKQARKLRGEPVSLKKLAKYSFVVMNQESNIHDLCAEHFSRANISPTISFTASRHLYLLNLVNAELGITILPQDLVDTNAFPDLVCLPFEEAMTTTIGIVRLKNHRESHPAELLYNFLADSGLMPKTEKREN